MVPHIETYMKTLHVEVEQPLCMTHTTQNSGLASRHGASQRSLPGRVLRDPGTFVKSTSKRPVATEAGAAWTVMTVVPTVTLDGRGAQLVLVLVLMFLSVLVFVMILIVALVWLQTSERNVHWALYRKLL